MSLNVCMALNACFTLHNIAELLRLYVTKLKIIKSHDVRLIFGGDAVLFRVAFQCSS